MRRLVTLAVACACVLGWPGAAVASTTTSSFGDSADAYVLSSNPTTNYGTVTSLRVDTSPVYASYLRFPVQKLTGPVQSAQLKLYAKASSSVGIDVRGVSDSSWTETGITYSNAPAYSSTIAATSGSLTSGAWLTIDVTSLIQSEVSGPGGSVNVALTANAAMKASGSIPVASRENGASTAPQLIITTADAMPVNVTAPTVSGTDVDGSTLSADPGSWSGSPSYAYQWQRCDPVAGTCANIPGAAGQTYQLTSSDVGEGVQVVVTATNVWGVGTATSWQTAIVQPLAPANTQPPAVSGQALDGATLTASTGSWSGTAPFSYGYQWQRCDAGGSGCAIVADATGSSYGLSSADVGHTVVVVVTATNQAGSSSATSAPTGVVQASPPVNTSPPTITGTTQYGQTVSAKPGQWLGTTPITYAYQWRDCTTSHGTCVDIPGATGQTYTIATRDVGNTLVVTVTAQNQLGSAGPATSAATAAVAAAASPSGDPTIAAAGDIACDPYDYSSGTTAANGMIFNGGLGTATYCHQLYTSNIMTNQAISALLPLGDDQYECGGLADFMASGAYNSTWGRFKTITRPVPGNHDYATNDPADQGNPSPGCSGNAQGYFDYFDGQGATTGPAGTRGQGYYSWDIGSWHMVALNTFAKCATPASSTMCYLNSAEYNWLSQDLSAHQNFCTLVYYHEPYYSSKTPGTYLKWFWQLMYSKGVDVVLNGHVHAYERFAPQGNQAGLVNLNEGGTTVSAPYGSYDPVSGIREFVVGTGGRSHEAEYPGLPTSEAQNSDTFGLLELTLHSTGYDWKFVPEAGGSYTDTGSGACHSAPGAPAANFSGSPTSGSSPLAVSFSDLSTGSPTSWRWDFGDGSTSTAENPSHTYTSPGTYTVVLTASNGVGSNTVTKAGYVTVSAPPVLPTADFSGSPASGSAPLAVSFSDLSTGSPTSWAWDFGDGSTSTAENPSHTYTSPGTYTVALTATNGAGGDTVTKAGYVTVSAPPVVPTADFSGSPASGSAPLAVSFSDLSTGSPTSWAWDFGDGSTSTAENPSHTYANPGTYTVVLTASNAAGGNTVTKAGYVTVSAPPVLPTADFSGSPASGSAPLAVSFSDLSTGSPTSWAWDFGDGSTSTAENPTHTYSAAGTYAVSLTATNDAGSNTVTKAGYVTVSAPPQSPVADFSGSPTSGSAPLAVSFSDQSTGSPTSWAWDFGDGSTSTAENPSHTYASPGTYTVVLTASNGVGSNTVTKAAYVTVSAPPVLPTADFSGSPTSGSTPLAVTFSDQSSGSPTSWAWDFGDGFTSTLRNPTHTYSAAGTYGVSLTATNSAGSNTATKSNYIVVNGVQTFTSIADSYVDSGTPTKNYGTGTVLSVDASPVDQSYLKFQLAGITGHTVLSAKLRIYCSDNGSVNGGSVAQTSNSSWGETTVTYNNRPAIDGPVLGKLGAVTAGTWYSVDVTPAVTGDGTISFGLQTSSSDGAHYSSREDAAHAPQLVVTLAPS